MKGQRLKNTKRFLGAVINGANVKTITELTSRRLSS